MTEKPHKQAVCARCGAAIDVADHFRISAADGSAQADLCRTEHIVAWVMRGAQWQVDRPWELEPEARSASGPVRLVRERAGERLTRDFESPDALRRWASAGGFWAREE